MTNPTPKMSIEIAWIEFNAAGKQVVKTHIVTAPSTKIWEKVQAYKAKVAERGNYYYLIGTRTA